MVDKVETPVPAIMKEAEMLRDMSHPNIVKFIDIFVERCFVCIVMEIYRGGDLVDGLQRQGPFESEKIVHIAYQTAASINHLHEHSVAHRDIKGDNCMMDREDMLDPGCRIVLTDFGTAAHLKPGEPFSSQVGTRQFWSPELLDKAYGLGVDIWAQGVLMYGLVTGRFPFKDENDIRKKEVKIRTKVDHDCKDYVLRMLEKSEGKRITSKAIMAHAYLSSMTKQSFEEPPDDIPMESGIPQMIREDGANVGIKDRRHELVERLHQEHHGAKTPQVRNRASLDLKPFTVESKSHPGERLGYEWWDEEAMKSSGLLDVLARAEPASPDATSNANDLSIFSTMLQDHGIDPRKFGSGSTKSLQTLASEVRSGEARLMLDATAHKKLVRVVEIVVLRLRCSDNRDKIIVEMAVSSKERGKYDTLRLPAKIRPPHENIGRCSERVLATLGLDNNAVTLRMDARETCEEEYESPSYPGVQTIYKKEIVEGMVNVAALSADQAAKLGLPGFSQWTSEDDKGVRFHEWMTEEEAQAKNVQFYMKGAGEVVSTLVHAPIGMNEQELEARLKAANVDVGSFGQRGTRTLKEFSRELYRGEAFLSENSTGELVRLVNVVVIILKDAKCGKTLVQTHQVDSRGAKKDKSRLPGNKCRPDENHFICARQTLRREVEIDENTVMFNEAVKFVEEQSLSSNYPGIKTIYRKFLITADL